MTNNQGFSLLELMVSLVIISILATIVIPVAEINIQRQKENELRHALREIRTAIDAYKRASDEGHIVKAPDTSGYPPTLQALVQGITDAKDPGGGKLYFLRRIPFDPLLNEPGVDPAASWGKRSYASEPNAPSEGRDIYDIYTRSDRIGLNGIPYNQW